MSPDAAIPGAVAVKAWARAAGHTVHRLREAGGHEGVVVTPRAESPRWRLEWGTPQRSYFQVCELRMRGELGVQANLQMLLITAALMQRLEKQVFEQYTEDLQTHIDAQTPEEVRWLVLLRKLSGSHLGALRESFTVVGNLPAALSRWMSPELLGALGAARQSWLDDATDLTIVVQHRRMTLRMAMGEATPERLSAAVSLFEMALREARTVAERFASAQTEGGASTIPSLWSRSVAEPVEPPAA